MTTPERIYFKGSPAEARAWITEHDIDLPLPSNTQETDTIVVQGIRWPSEADG